MSTKKSPILKYWLTTGSVAFGASCGCSLPFTQNLAQSALVGLAAIPGVAVSTSVRSRQRQQQVNRQLERGKLRLNQLQYRGEILNKQLRLRDKDRQEVEIRVAQLHVVAANLNDRIDTDRQLYQQLEQQLASLAQYCQEQQNFATKLDRKIQDKQALNLELETNFNILKTEISQLQTAKIQTIDTIDRFKISLRNIQSEIERCATTKQELELEIQQLQRQEVDNGSFDLSLDRQHQLIHELDSAISNRSQTQQHLTAEIERLEQILAERSTELADRDRELTAAQLEFNETELAVKAKQAKLDELAAEILAWQNEIESSPDYLAKRLQQRELKIARLELSSRQAELENLEVKIQAKRQEIGEIDLDKTLQTFEPKPPTVDRDIDAIAVTGAWQDKFIDNPHLTVLQHIEKHGTITEAEASSKLGNARSVRQFANKLEEYAQDLPFAIRVEASPKGNRYLKLIDN